MNINFSAAVELKPADVEALVKGYIAKATPTMEVGRIEFDVAKESRGYGMNEYDEVVFRGVKVHLTPKVNQHRQHDGRGPG